MSLAHWRGRVSVVFLLARRDFYALLFRPGIYVTLFLAMVSAAVILSRYLDHIAREGLFLTGHPFQTPLYIAVLLSSLYLAISSASSVAREKESGTLLVLFMGPLDHSSYILGVFLGQIASFVVIQILLLIYFSLLSSLTQFVFSPAMLWGIILSLVAVSGVVSLGILLSVAMERVRVAILYFVLVITVLLALQGADSFLSTLSPEQPHQLVILGQAVHAVNRVARWASPYSYLVSGLNAASAGQWNQFLLVLLGSVIYTGIFLVFAVRLSKRKGVRP